MKDGKSRAASPIASDVSLSDEEEEVEVVEREELMRFTGTGTEEEFGKLIEDLRVRSLGEKMREVVARQKGRGVVAETVAEQEVEVAKPKVRLLSYEDKKGKRRRLGSEGGVEEGKRGRGSIDCPAWPQS